jgi:YD repeat-containing protein
LEMTVPIVWTAAHHSKAHHCNHIYSQQHTITTTHRHIDTHRHNNNTTKHHHDTMTHKPKMKMEITTTKPHHNTIKFKSEFTRVNRITRQRISLQTQHTQYSCNKYGNRTCATLATNQTHHSYTTCNKHSMH